ncbi:MAG TPA: helix-turn-helix transcriptional regulator [Propionibacteriaceae bacterium]|nr:helix-turn-helix transcriptional regulator [Propionibacteriaceae bacterium]
MSSLLPQLVDRDAPIFTISVAANLSGMHPQTLRTYDRLGLVRPQRAAGRGRRYSPRDITKLRLVQHLSQEEGINLIGIRRIIEMQDELERVRDESEALRAALADAQAAFSGARVFTAESSGAVHLGRHVPRTRLALPGR